MFCSFSGSGTMAAAPNSLKALPCGLACSELPWARPARGVRETANATAARSSNDRIFPPDGTVERAVVVKILRQRFRRCLPCAFLEAVPDLVVILLQLPRRQRHPGRAKDIARFPHAGEAAFDSARLRLLAQRPFIGRGVGTVR